MRRISLAFALAALLLAAPTLAHASHHRMAPVEVLLSSGGDDAIQYIELEDVATEGFPNDDYVLAIYDVDGTLIDSVSFDVVASTTRFLVGTAAADTEFGTSRDATLPVTLPEDGQACFELATGTKFGCLAWGCVNTVLIGTTTIPFNMSGRGASPPDGMSLQRFVTDNTPSYSVLAPTPDEVNDSGTPGAACPSDPDAGPSEIDAGTETGDDAGPGNPDGGGSGGDGGDGDEDSGCGCGMSSPRSAANALALIGFVLLAGRLRRFRGKGTRT